jgi:peptidoglycan glycosyltransferase
MMEAVVSGGTGTAAQIAGVRVAGKTGTAQSAQGRAPYAWFTSFAPADNPQVAVAVLIEDANIPSRDVYGGRVAAPVAKAIMQAVIK